jgi:hypothetical protein
MKLLKKIISYFMDRKSRKNNNKNFYGVIPIKNEPLDKDKLFI